jgi:negative regulator of sigma E activity
MNHDDEPLDDRLEEPGDHDPQLDELLSAYVDGELTGPELAKVELRLQQDTNASEWVAEVQQLSRLMQSLPRQSPGPELRSQVLRQVAQEQAMSTGNPLASSGSSSASEPPGTLRRWLWPGLAIAAALLLMFLQSNQPEVERRVAGRSEKREAKGEGRGMKIESKPAAQMAPLPTSEELADSLQLAEDSAPLAKDRVKAMPRNRPSSPASPASDLPAVSQYSSPNVAKPLSMGRSGHFAKSKSASARSTKSDFVVQVIVSDPLLDGGSFRTLLTEHGMKPLEGARLSSLPQEHSREDEKEVLERLETRDRSAPALPGERVDRVVVETLPKQFHRLLHAYRGNPTLQGRYHIQEAKIQQKLSISGNLQETAQMPIRITFELRRPVPGDSIQKEMSDRTTE